jgi:hypothetical protein
MSVKSWSWIVNWELRQDIGSKKVQVDVRSVAPCG